MKRKLKKPAPINVKPVAKREKTRRLLIFLAVVMLSLTSCESEEFGKEDIDGGVLATFTTTISAQQESTAITRAVGTTWHKDDAIGIFAKMNGETLSNESIYNGYINLKYLSSKEGTTTDFIAATEKQIMFPKNETKLDFIAYYPYDASVTDFSLNVDISQQSPQSAIDILYATANEYTYENPDVQFGFKRALSRLQLQFTSDYGLNLEGMLIEIENASTKGILNLIDGKITIGAEKQSLTPIITYDTINNILNTSAILLPGQQLDQLRIKIQLTDGNKHIWIPETYTLNTSISRIYKFNITPGEVQLTSSGSTIRDWEDDTHDPIIDVKPIEDDSDWEPIVPDEPEIPETPGDGTEENPYSIAEALVSEVKTEVWVEGYIIGYAETTGNKFSLGNTDLSSSTAGNSIVLVSNILETNVDLMLPVSLISLKSSDPTMYSKLNLNNVNLIGRKVKILCKLGISFLTTGGKDVTNYEFLN